MTSVGGGRMRWPTTTSNICRTTMVADVIVIIIIRRLHAEIERSVYLVCAWQVAARTISTILRTTFLPAISQHSSSLLKLIPTYAQHKH